MGKCMGDALFYCKARDDRQNYICNGCHGRKLPLSWCRFSVHYVFLGEDGNYISLKPKVMARKFKFVYGDYHLIAFKTAKTAKKADELVNPKRDPEFGLQLPSHVLPSGLWKDGIDLAVCKRHHRLVPVNIDIDSPEYQEDNMSLAKQIRLHKQIKRKDKPLRRTRQTVPPNLTIFKMQMRTTETQTHVSSVPPSPSQTESPFFDRMATHTTKRTKRLKKRNRNPETSNSSETPQRQCTAAQRQCTTAQRQCTTAQRQCTTPQRQFATPPHQFPTTKRQCGQRLRTEHEHDQHPTEKHNQHPTKKHNQHQTEKRTQHQHQTEKHDQHRPEYDNMFTDSDDMSIGDLSSLDMSYWSQSSPSSPSTPSSPSDSDAMSDDLSTSISTDIVNLYEDNDEFDFFMNEVSLY